MLYGIKPRDCYSVCHLILFSSITLEQPFALSSHLNINGSTVIARTVSCRGILECHRCRTIKLISRKLRSSSRTEEGSPKGNDCHNLFAQQNVFQSSRLHNDTIFFFRDASLRNYVFKLQQTLRLTLHFPPVHFLAHLREEKLLK